MGGTGLGPIWEKPPRQIELTDGLGSRGHYSNRRVLGVGWIVQLPAAPEVS